MKKISERYTEIGEAIKAELFPELEDVSVAWLESDQEKRVGGGIRCAECTKVSSSYEWCCPYDFYITVFEPNVERMTDAQIKILLEHELMHIGHDDKRNWIVDHNVQEFREIIRKYGMDWASEQGAK